MAYEMLDPTVASVVVSSDRLVITGLASGSTQLDVSRRDESVVIIPDAGVTYVPLPVVVT